MRNEQGKTERLVHTERDQVKLELGQLALATHTPSMWKSFYWSHGREIVVGLIVAALVSLVGWLLG